MKRKPNGGEKYPVGSHWKMKASNGFHKGDEVVIIDNGEPGKHRKVIVRDCLGRDRIISVKDFWFRIS